MEAETPLIQQLDGMKRGGREGRRKEFNLAGPNLLSSSLAPSLSFHLADIVFYVAPAPTFPQVGFTRRQSLAGHGTDVLISKPVRPRRSSR